MTRWIFALFSMAVLSAAVPTATQEKEVMAAMDAWIQATVHQDIAAPQRILHDELWYSHSAGTFQTKEEVIKDVQEGRGPVGIELSDTRIRIYDNAALVKSMVIVRNRPRNQAQAGASSGGGRNTADGAANPPGGANAGPTPLLIVHVLVKGSQGWQLVSRQATRPAAPRTAPNPAH